MSEMAGDLARRLACASEAVCRHYLSNGRREGRYWLVGDVENTPGRSLYVRLRGPETGRGAAGKWTDAATGEHGDLLDLIAANRGHRTLHETLDEARRFLAMPPPEPSSRYAETEPAIAGSPEAARRLFAMSRPIRGTVAETYLRGRGLIDLRRCAALRFHPRCWHRADAHDPWDHGRDAWPALIAAVTDLGGEIVGVHRTWLAPDGLGKAPVLTPRRAMGRLLGAAVWFGTVSDVMAAGEGIETVLSLRQALTKLPMAAALSANHLAALGLPPRLRRLYILRDTDAAGDRAVEALSRRAIAAGIEAVALHPRLGDFNEDLRRLSRPAFADEVRSQLAPEDVARFTGDRRPA